MPILVKAIPTATEGLKVELIDRTVQFGELSCPRFNYLRAKILAGDDHPMKQGVQIWSPDDDGVDGDMIFVSMADLIEALQLSGKTD